MALPFTTDDQTTAIEELDTVVTSADLTDLLLAVQEDVEDRWADHMAAVEAGDLGVVAEKDEVLVFADRTGQFWQTHFDDLTSFIELIDGEHEGTVDAVLATHHNAAYRLADHNWATANPVVLAKPETFDSGLLYVEAVVNHLISQGLSPGQAWAYYGIMIRGNSRNKWAERCGYADHSVVSEAVRKGTEKLRSSLS